MKKTLCIIIAIFCLACGVSFAEHHETAKNETNAPHKEECADCKKGTCKNEEHKKAHVEKDAHAPAKH